MRGADAVETLLRSCRFLGVRRDLDDALPCARSPLEVLLPEGADDTDDARAMTG